MDIEFGPDEEFIDYEALDASDYDPQYDQKEEPCATSRKS